ncbi:MAG TPA: hypothetical protein CFH84_07620 [Sulfurimonas sp. UBA12504]|nr:MAG: hypothetical protein A2019_06910 [Sulfurimonas sp. GWF2_37_8]DAB29810.1 MAG TPA: hypothetical protein CFH84_07620 [Sulfurimonas sp. UBA12504]
MKLQWDTLNIATTESLHEALLPLLQSKEEVVTLDLKNVNKLDLSAVQLFLSLQKSLAAQNRKLSLSNCTNSVLTAFELCGCLKQLGCSDE